MRSPPKAPATDDPPPPSSGNGGSKLYTRDKAPSPHSGRELATDHRAAIATYIGAGRHVLPERKPDRSRVKSIPQIARELGMDKSSARRWLRRDHFDTWFEHWPTIDAILALSQSDRSVPAAMRPSILDSLPPPDPDAIAREGQEHE